LSEFPDLANRYPPNLLEQRARVASKGAFRQRVQFDLVERPQHAFGLLAAADIASFTGLDEFVALEFGVAEGAGLRNLAEVAAMVAAETGVRVDVVGFDSGQGLPAPLDYRDHPEIWVEGDFPMPDADALRAALPADVELVLGPVATTLPQFLSTLAKPIGFASFDLDLYSSTRDALTVFDVECDRLLPVVVSYFDDVLGGIRRIGSLFRTKAAGQLRAIEEFNTRQSRRRIDPIWVLRHRRPLDREAWIERMYGLHVLDHPIRNGKRSRRAMSMLEHGQANQFDWPW
jgi:hypothetical protein